MIFFFFGGSQHSWFHEQMATRVLGTRVRKLSPNLPLLNLFRCLSLVAEIARMIIFLNESAQHVKYYNVTGTCNGTANFRLIS